MNIHFKSLPKLDKIKILSLGIYSLRAALISYINFIYKPLVKNGGGIKHILTKELVLLNKSICSEKIKFMPNLENEMALLELKVQKLFPFWNFF